jgi:methylated-DNA-[protein]-cysteine S-methyltransferase
LVVEAEGDAVTEVRFVRKGWMGEVGGGDSPVLREARAWLAAYFSGRVPGKGPKVRLEGASAFRLAVLEVVSGIPYGATATYGEVARAVAGRLGGRPCARAVGGVVGWNPVCLLIPCHRVVGAGGALGGYGGGVENKRALLALESAIWVAGRGERG